LFQGAVFAAFFLLLYRATWPLDSYLRLKLFLELDPFYSLVSIAAARLVVAGLLLSLITVGASVVFGRVFCGYFCPMGILTDLADYSGVKSLRRRKENYEAGRGIAFKYYVLGASLAAAALGFSLVFLFDPLSIFTRFSALVVYPFSVIAAETALRTLRPLADSAGFVGLAHAHLVQPIFDSNIITAILVFFIVALNMVAYRAWCRYACPAGAMMGLLSLGAPWRRRVSEACDDCGACRRKCHMGCIPEDARQHRQSECIACYSCVRVCPKDAVSFGFGRLEPRRLPVVTQKGRRVFLGSVLTGGIVAGLFRTHVNHPTDLKDPIPLRPSRLIRPPGALPEPDFLPACTRCGECMRACVTNTLQPAWLESGLEGLWTPRLVMRYAACEQQCNVCGQVCPTGAIRPLPMQEKLNAKIGTAYLVKERCLAWARDTRCLICDEQCPYNAVVMKREPGHKNLVPHVEPKKCNGCGQCEDRCPVEGESAIIIDIDGEVRLKTGSYVERARELGLSFQAEENATDDFDEGPGDDKVPSDKDR
jgi:MauM/NapG family ferredoxin protein